MGKTVTRKSDFTEVSPRFQRSVNLRNDMHNRYSSKGYIVSPNVASSIDRISKSILSKGLDKAFALAGPYGSGKSAFTLFFCQLLQKNPVDAQRMLDLIPSSFGSLLEQVSSARRAPDGREGFLSIPVTARRRPVTQVILEGLREAVSNLKQLKSVRGLRNNIDRALQENAWTDSGIIIHFLKILTDLAKSQKYAGVILVVDEAGKTLEYALHDSSGGDVYIFQELAEHANRQVDMPFLFLITLHQMFDEYVGLSDQTLRNEWNKVQERFQSIQFIESAATTMQIVSSALARKKELPESIRYEMEDALIKVKNMAIPLPIGVKFSEFAVMARNAWPLHPTVLLALPYLFRRLAQNERSIFSYLSSPEPYGFQEHLEKQVSTEDTFIRLHHIYTYLLANFEAGLARLPHAKRLLEANDIISSRQHLSELQLKLVKTTALLNVLSEICPLRATLETIACSSVASSSVQSELEVLKHQSLLTYRRLDGSYRIWEGSDVDIDVRVSEARRKLQIEGKSPMESLCQHLPERTLIASRHSLETGVQRYFNLVYKSSINQSILQSVNQAAGTVILLLPQGNSEAIVAKAEKLTNKEKRLIIALPHQIGALRRVVEEVACLRWVELNTEELRDDRIARRELSLRLAMGDQFIAQYMQTLLDPRPAPAGNSCKWIWNGEDQELRKPVDVTRLLSKVCDGIFFQSAKLRNELIMRKRISSAAASARRVLLHRMLNNRSEVRLGIEGYPPERSIYESVLASTGIHYFNEESELWDFQPPLKEHHSNLRPAWDVFEKEIFSESFSRIKLTSLFNVIAEAPFGLPAGVHPLLFMAYYLYNQGDLFLYRDDSFLPALNDAHMELLQRRPDLFSVSGAKLLGVRKSVVDRLAKGLKQDPKTASVVRALYQTLDTLPKVTLDTKQFLDREVISFRNSFLNAKSPEMLLFVELPKCFRLSPFSIDTDRDSDIELFFDNLNRCLRSLDEFSRQLLVGKRNTLLNKCGFAMSDEGWTDFEKVAAYLVPRIRDDVLSPILSCIVTGALKDSDPGPVLSLLAKRSFEQWSDDDIKRFDSLASGFGELFIAKWEQFKLASNSLTKEQVKQKISLKTSLMREFETLWHEQSKHVIIVALRELLGELEKTE